MTWGAIVAVPLELGDLLENACPVWLHLPVSEILTTGIAILVLKAYKPLHRDKVASTEGLKTRDLGLKNARVKVKNLAR